MTEARALAAAVVAATQLGCYMLPPEYKEQYVNGCAEHGGFRGHSPDGFHGWCHDGTLLHWRPAYE